MADPAQPHLLLVNLGTPEAPTPESVRVFLSEFLGDPAVVDLPRWLWNPILDRMVLRSRPSRVAEMYRSIWSERGSPLRVATERMVSAARAHASDACTVSSAYRYGDPSLESEMHRLAGGRSGPVVVVPLFPQRTDATTGTAFKRAREAAARAGISARYREALVTADDGGYVAALADRCRATFDAHGAPDHLVVSFHGIPVRYDRRERGEYTRDCQATTRALLGALDWPASRATLAYQSKFGPEPWLRPATASVIQTLARKGARRVAVVTPGFLTHGLETLEEIAMRGHETFVAAGGSELHLVGTVEDHPAMIASLVRLATAGNAGACIA